MRKNQKSILSMRGVLFLLTRFGGVALRHRALDEKYSHGDWECFDKEHSIDVVNTVARYARKGRILDMGCGTGILASMLDPESFESYRGVDASPQAITFAQKRKCSKVEFEIGDIQSYECQDDFDLIVFDESLYYVPFLRHRCLRRYARHLRPGGMFLVTMADPGRFAGMLRMIRRNFRVIEDRTLPNSCRQLLVFG